MTSVLCMYVLLHTYRRNYAQSNNNRTFIGKVQARSYTLRCFFLIPVFSLSGFKMPETAYESMGDS